MSFTSTVPAVVPSVFQSSDPFAASLATKKITPPDRVSFEKDETPELMLFTASVPDSLPSVFHRPPPLPPSPAVKRTDPFSSMNGPGNESPGPGLMSFTCRVPARVPSLAQSS
jgi:hypothetical protein